MPNRTVCDALKEIRALNEARNYGCLLGLVEEVQSMVNRMEAALYDQADLRFAHKELKRLNAEIEKLKEEKVALGGKEESSY